jgi:hypothetical protein
MNDFKTGEQIAAVAAQLASQDLGLTKYVKTDVGLDFHASTGKTVNVRVPGVTTVSERPVGSTENYTLGAIAEQFIPVTLTSEAYSAVPLSLADTTLNLKDYSAQVLRPQALSVANHIDHAVAACLAGSAVEASITYDPSNPRVALTKARAILRKRGVSAEIPITAIVGPDVYADVLDAEILDANGKIAGIEIVENSLVDAGALHVFVKAAFVAALRAPEVPEGLANAASVIEGNMALRALTSFDGRSGVTLSVLSSFVGVAPMPLAIPNFATGEVDLVEGAGIVSVDTTA